LNQTTELIGWSKIKWGWEKVVKAQFFGCLAFLS
jgi:hypothetical protein